MAGRTGADDFVRAAICARQRRPVRSETPAMRAAARGSANRARCCSNIRRASRRVFLGAPEGSAGAVDSVLLDIGQHIAPVFGEARREAPDLTRTHALGAPDRLAHRRADRLGSRGMDPAPTPEQYLELDRAASDAKYEFLNGIVVAMAGASPRHNMIVTNLVALLRDALKDGPCRVFASDQRVHSLATEAYIYPDLSVVCDPPDFSNDKPASLRNPAVVVEVLSTSTRDHDRGAKPAHYRRIPSVREVLLVEPNEVRVERYQRRPDDQWLLTDVTEGDVQLASVDATLSLSAIYDKSQDLPES